MDNGNKEFFKINKSKCKGEGACIAECPRRILIKGGADNCPVMIQSGEKLCIQCGHCIAVCPQGAVELSFMPRDSCKILEPDWMLSPAIAEQFMKGRRSIRNFTGNPVEKKVLEKVIDLARYAPSGINRQPVLWTIIHEPERVAELSRMVIEWTKDQVKANSPVAKSYRFEELIDNYEQGFDSICRSAPHIVFANALKEDPTAGGSCTIALTYFELAAASFNLGSCWAGYVTMAVNQSPSIQEFVGLQKRLGCFGAMLTGYPRYSYVRIPARKPARINWV
jgi:nitroreductase/NAD-dependent dihydropyrimidine dehydrogenase PreA subunit